MGVLGAGGGVLGFHVDNVNTRWVSLLRVKLEEAETACPEGAIRCPSDGLNMGGVLGLPRKLPA